MMTNENVARVRYAVAFGLFWIPELGEMKIGDMRATIEGITRLVIEAMDDPRAPQLEALSQR